MSLPPEVLRDLRLTDAGIALDHARAAQNRRARLYAADADGIDAEGDDARDRAYAAAMFDLSVEGYRRRLDEAGADERVSPDERGIFPPIEPLAQATTATVIPFRARN